MTELPDEIWERVFSFLPSNGPSVGACVQLNSRFRRISRNFLNRKRRNFALKCASPYPLSDVSVSYLRGSLLPTSKGPSERYGSSVAFLKGTLYVFGGYIDPNTALNDCWSYSCKNETWDRVVCSKVPQAKGGAIMIADPKRDRMILYGGKLSEAGQNIMFAFRTDVGLYPNDINVLNVSQKKRDWQDIRLPNCCEGRTQAAGCILPELDVVILDGGSFDERNPLGPQQTLALDVRNGSPTSWRWARVDLQGDIPPFPRALHAVVPIGRNSMIFTSNVARDFKFCTIEATSDIQGRRSFTLTFTNINTEHIYDMPAYLRGTRFSFCKSSCVMTWISPVKLSDEEPQQTGMAIHRLKFDKEQISVTSLPRSPCIELNGEAIHCILGTSFNMFNFGFMTFGGAEPSPASVNVWSDLNGIRDVKPTNHLMFLQI